MKLFIKPVIFAVIVTAVWVLFRSLGINDYIQGDEGVMVSGTTAILGLIYAVFATFVVVTVWGQWVAVEEAVQSGDKAKFLLNKDKRIPRTLKFLLFLCSSFLVSALFLVFFRHPLTGGFSMFMVTLLISIFWSVIMDLDDPFTGAWNVEVPEGWREKEAVDD